MKVSGMKLGGIKRGVLALVCVASSAAAVAQDVGATLREKLAPMQTLQAQFQQTVTDQQDELVQRLNGSLMLQRPNLMRWETEAPDESLMVADGAAVWYFNPFVEQVSVYDQGDAVAQSPLLLLLKGEPESWANYRVSQQGQSYTVEPKAANSQATLELVFSQSGQLKDIYLHEPEGQMTHLALSDVRMNQPIAASQFQFTPPEGVAVDDQRQAKARRE